MEKTGLFTNYVEQMSSDWKAYSHKENSPEAKSFQAGLSTTLSLLKDIGTSKQPELILLTEKATLSQELATYANSAEIMNSLKPALAEIDAASQVLQLVQNHKAYAEASTSYAPKRKQSGLPMDAFREFVLSHTARLTNRLKGTVSVSEKNILRQRKENLNAANERYMDLQRSALGMSNELEMNSSSDTPRRV